MTTTEPESARPESASGHPHDPAAWGEPRSKTITWHDPLPVAAAAASLSGLEFLSAMRDGRIPPPPISRLFDFRPVEVAPGDVVFTCLPDESAYNPIGLVHGGLVCTILDTATACAVHSTLAAAVAYTSIEIKVNYLRPVRVVVGRPSRLTAHGWVTRPGRRVAFAEGDVRDDQGKVVATASSTCLIMGETA
ncbi:aromatic compound degradation protein PaaI [Frankia sp. CcI156]|jgi:uncharacterized protein (TIGR00369 family)|uniref:Phenylacetic acid degradation-related protein n=1 Tax=Frankia casuarinae (strain DSM 45818 / CECT 9043 / HFP020203 / CcI3) TaxID=106370 RepID=Q2JET2_FRACC|nr:MULTISPECIES: PaaI family thioesterase [Frankia]ABD10210.1 Phenylacetic acid degradation-related protein [Frankia casuarinae]ETA01608.1 uncharacterized protein, possibly involved in aromatic compounds catabolism [Frankia sp. CcI6]EYT93918.1 uncharacterized protein, possibly involved in aromatic compounds catabolism [Frankia casuarinae]KDA43443.1 uncharacterized protein, possibly involved in aromatic compounds catabolism [Frankia sp. BMG5.23]KEZ38416.1 hypothetical protein CEDDRAFT_00154 [Fr